MAARDVRIWVPASLALVAVVAFALAFAGASDGVIVAAGTSIAVAALARIIVGDRLGKAKKSEADPIHERYEPSHPAAELPFEPPRRVSADVPDLMAALRASLARTKARSLSKTERLTPEERLQGEQLIRLLLTDEHVTAEQAADALGIDDPTRKRITRVALAAVEAEGLSGIGEDELAEARLAAVELALALDALSAQERAR